MDLASIGLILIAVAWLIQLFFVIKGKKEIQPFFIIFYMLGVAFLVISAYLASSVISYYELGTLVAAAIVLVYSFKKK